MAKMSLKKILKECKKRAPDPFIRLFFHEGFWLWYNNNVVVLRDDNLRSYLGEYLLDEILDKNEEYELSIKEDNLQIEGLVESNSHRRDIVKREISQTEETIHGMEISKLLINSNENYFRCVLKSDEIAYGVNKEVYDYLSGLLNNKEKTYENGDFSRLFFFDKEDNLRGLTIMTRFKLD